MSSWFTSSYSDPERSWVQVRFDGEQVLVADSKDRGAGPVITVDGRAWDEFVVAALSGEPEPTDALCSAPLPDRGRTVVAEDGTTLYFTRAEWDAFIAGAADGEFRRPAVV